MSKNKSLVTYPRRFSKSVEKAPKPGVFGIQGLSGLDQILDSLFPDEGFEEIIEMEAGQDKDQNGQTEAGYRDESER